MIKKLIKISILAFLWSFQLYSQAILPRSEGEQKDSNYSLDKLATTKNIIPVAVLGSGPAGLTAAMYTARANFMTVVFGGDEIGGQLTEASYVENWPAKPKMAGADIMKDAQTQAKKFGVQILPVKVVKVNFATWPFQLTLDNDDTVHVMAVIIATGGSQKTMDIPGVKEFWGKGIGVCSICDAPFDKGKDVAIIGGGDAAADRALQLSSYAKNVTILVRAPEMRAAAVVQGYLKQVKNIKIIYNVEVKKILGDTSVTGVEISDNATGKSSTLPFQSVYFALGFVPRSELFKGQLEIDKDGYIKVFNNTQNTSKKGIFAAGTVEDSHYQKSASAAGQGSQAGMDAIEFIQQLGFTPETAKKVEQFYYKVPSE